MFRSHVAIGVLALILLAALLGGLRLNALNRERAIAQFQHLELSTAEKLAALLESEVDGASRTLRTVAHTLPAPRGLYDDLVNQQNQCDEGFCFTALSVFDRDGAQQPLAGPTIALTPHELHESLTWARSAPGGQVRVTIASPNPPSLVLFTPLPSNRDNGGMLAAQLSLDALFRNHQSSPTAGWPNYETLVIERAGTVLFQSAHPEMRLNNIFRRTDRCFSCHDSFDHVERILAAKHGVLGYDVKGTHFLTALAPVRFPEAEWIVAIKVPSTVVVGLLGAQVRQLGAVMLVTVLLGAAAGAIAWRDGRRRIAAEAAAVEQAHLEQSHRELSALNIQLGHAAREWRTTVDMLDAALILIEPDGSILRMNLAAAATLPGGFPAWLGRPSAHLIDRQPWSHALVLAGSLHADGQVSAMARARDTSAAKTWDLGCRLLPDRERRTVLILARDVTDVVDLQASVQRSETMAALGTLVVGVAHEVRNPLFAISSLVDAWAVQPHRDPTPFVDALRSEVNRLRTLMVELLEYGRPAKFTRQVQSLREVIDGAMRACAHEAALRNVSVRFTPANDVDVLMDSRRLERVFINLIQNAVQHAPAQSAVDVDVLAPAPADLSRVEVTVRDHGPGFAPEDLPQAFRPFFSRRQGGFGLGLAITERIVTEHQGTVSAANDPRGGAVITVSLPVTHARSTGSLGVNPLCSKADS